jgi:xanthine dehydrogenase accessory factor
LALIEAGFSAPVDEARILRQAEDWARAGRGAALATVIETFGSAPRPIGSHLAVEAGGGFCGSVSAGCVEGDVITAAQDAIADGAPRRLEFGVADETAWRAGLSCGGRIAVHVARLDADSLEALAAANAEIAARRPCALLTPLGGGPTRLVAPDAPEALLLPFRRGRSALARCAGRDYFVDVRLPGPRLVLVGAVHVAQALAPMARLAGFDVVVVDPRGAYAAPERFPQMALDMRWPEEALPELGLDAFTALVVLTHDPRIDDPALIAALGSACFYVGALGSRATHARRLERLISRGLADQTLARLRGPVGLDIAAVSPAEIAVAILAEIILARGQKPLHGAAASGRVLAGACG